MHELEIGYDLPNVAESVLGRQIEQPSVIDNLNRKKAILEAQLKSVNEAIEALAAAPETVRIINLLRKTNQF